MVHGGIETEVKIRIGDPGEALARIHGAGFEKAVERAFEANTLYDKPDGELRAQGMVLRLRQAGEQGVITWKSRGETGRHKSRVELETTVGSIEVLEHILQRLGYERTVRYEKFRTEFKRPHESAGAITVDETPAGNFMELEGTPEWIDATAAALGYSEADYVLDSYVRLYVADCERRGVPVGDMVFSK